MSLVYPGSESLVTNPETPPGSQPLKRPEPIIKADRLEYLIWDIADVQAQEAFLQDFGMQTVQIDADTLVMRCHGTQQYLYWGRKAKHTRFVGAGFCVELAEQLDTLAQATGRPIEQLNRPGGGHCVTLEGPNGILIEVCHGIAPQKPLPSRTEVLPVNTPENKVRINQGQRPALEASAIMKLGHLVMGVHRIEEAAEWYMRHLGFIASDVLCIDDGSPALCFMRLDRGGKPADHHAIAIGKGAGVGYVHSAYEVLDLDSIAQGQQFLKSKKREHVWGIGRHILGSQLFDYWKDPSGFEFEHYADGDVLTADQPTNYHPLDPGNIYSWGPDMPANMIKPGPTQIMAVLKAAMKGEISLAWLKSAMKSTARPPRPWK